MVTTALTGSPPTTSGSCGHRRSRRSPGLGPLDLGAGAESYGRYTRIGRTIFSKAEVVLGTDSGIGATPGVIFGLPVAPHVHARAMPIALAGFAQLFQSQVTHSFGASAVVDQAAFGGTPGVAVLVAGFLLTGTFVNATLPNGAGTLGAGSTLRWTATYEAATAT